MILRDLATGTRLVSRATGGRRARRRRVGERGDRGRRAPGGLRIRADNLSAQDEDAVRDVFVRDVVLGTTALVSRADGAAGVGGDAISSLPSVSADGRKVAFYSEADNLSSEDDDAVADIYVRDVIDGTTLLVSRATGLAGAGANGGSFSSEISDDGRFVAFDSVAPNLSGEDADPGNDVFVRDLVARTTTLVSRATGGGARRGTRGRSIRPSRPTAATSPSPRSPTTSRRTTATRARTSSSGTSSPEPPPWSGRSGAAGAPPPTGRR